jgi:hypothetical protein
LVNDFRRLVLYFISYIKMEFPSPVPESLGLTILLNIGGMALSVALEITQMFLEPEFDPGVIGMATVGMLPSPPGTVVPV